MPLPTVHLPARRALLLAGLAWATATAPARAGLPEVVAAARPAVVAIGVFDPLASPRFTFRGTGFGVGDGRLVATNAHVLPDDPQALAQLALLPAGAPRTGNEAQLPVRKLVVVSVDRLRDLAVLRLEGPPLPTLTLATQPAREGQAVALIGFPLGGLLGFSPVTHRGIVASIAPFALPPPDAARLDAAAVARLRQPPFDIYQLDATAYPGNSGGPLLDAETGQVLGLVNMVLVKNGRESLLSSPSGISYAIPVSHLRALIDRP
ncbi:S1 family peptidase [Pseudaquabacterium pictum]|uniref:S1 family peptidase n=1 Tax=Pseudaquabacterium pictum TaxID=2315236 RepID=UPI001D133CC9|nr:serine protease [Rubrivivax pictus]